MVVASTGNVAIAPISLPVEGMVIRIVEPQREQGGLEKAGTTSLDQLMSALELVSVSNAERIKVIYALEQAGALRARLVIK